MRVPSISSRSPSAPQSRAIRIAPQQDRSERRLAGFLDAAARLFAELGYEAVTMTEVAARSDSSIGALYNYFPDKQSLALTLALQYAQELEATWKPLIEQAAKLTHTEFAHRFIDLITAFVQERPAYLTLVEGPIRLRRDPASRKASRLTLAGAFLASTPSLSKEQSLLIANATVQIIRGMMALYAEADTKSKPTVVLEFKKILTLYLEDALSTKGIKKALPTV